MTVDVYKDDKVKQEQIYREAIRTQKINLDAWAGLAKLYVEDSTKTEEDYYNLEKEMMEALKCFPFPMYDLSNYIKSTGIQISEDIDIEEVKKVRKNTNKKIIKTKGFP